MQSQGDLIPQAIISFYVSFFIACVCDYCTRYSSLQLPDICVESEVSATYILEVKNSSGHIVRGTTADYHQSVLIEERWTLEASDSYTVNVTVFVPLYAGLGSQTNIIELEIGAGA